MAADTFWRFLLCIPNLMGVAILFLEGLKNTLSPTRRTAVPNAEQPWRRTVQWFVRFMIVVTLILILCPILYDVDWLQITGIEQVL